VRKRADEATLRRQIAARSELAKRYRGAWDAIAKAVRGKREPWLRAAAFNRLTASQLLGQALTLVRLPAVLGERVYPDATFTLRVSYGTVKGWREGDHDVRPFTTLGGLYERVTGSEPFVLPKRWMERKAPVALDTPFNLSADTDIIGGNSGSPMIDRNGRIVGLVFDGNIHSIGSEYWFDEANNRTAAVDSRWIRETLKSIYQAERILTALVAPLEPVSKPGAHSVAEAASRRCSQG
jgi:hypothetical protein